MMQQEKKDDLIQEVEALVQKRLSDGQETPVAWLAKAIVDGHRDTIRGAGVDWFLLRAYEAVRSAVRQVVRRYDADEEVDPQLILPGFPEMQCGYLVTRDGEQKLLPTGECSDEELREKIAELRRMSAGCLKHARAIERYLDERRRKVASSP